VDHPWVRQVQRINIDGGPGGTRAIVLRLYGVWCLKRSTPSTWDVLTLRGRGDDVGDLFWSASAVLQTAYQYSPSTTPADKVALEVAAGLAAAGRAPEELLNALGSSNTPAAQSVLSNFLNSPAPRFRAAGLAGLLSRGQPGSVASFGALWPSSATTAIAGLLPYPRFAMIFALLTPRPYSSLQSWRKRPPSIRR